jgi:hypothetical protein
MILYTMMPQELIFPAENSTTQTPKQWMVNYQGIPLMVEMSEGQSAEVIRVLSTDPQHFMDNRVAPGSKISLANLEGLSAL